MDDDEANVTVSGPMVLPRPTRLVDLWNDIYKSEAFRDFHKDIATLEATILKQDEDDDLEEEDDDLEEDEDDDLEEDEDDDLEEDEDDDDSFNCLGYIDDAGIFQCKAQGSEHCRECPDVGAIGSCD
jgi:hypothetical protein